MASDLRTMAGRVEPGMRIALPVDYAGVSMAMTRPLIERGAVVQAFDPEGMEEAAKLLDGVVFKDGPYDALAGADAAVIMTEWNQFRALDLDRIKLLLKQPVMVDLRNVYRRDLIARHGFRYVSVGRPKEDIPVALSTAAE